MNLQHLIDHITPEIHRNLKRAVEIGKWPDGRPLTQEQRELSLQAVIAYEAVHLEEHERIGYIDRGSKEEGEVCSDEHEHGREQILKWK
jgi:uncharacterized protein